MSKQNLPGKSKGNSSKGSGQDLPTPIPETETNIIPEQLEELMEGLPEEKQILLQQILINLSYNNHPFPSPRELKGYNSIVKGGAQRIFVMVEEQTKHRHIFKMKKLSISGWTVRLGQWFGFFIALAGLGAGTYLTLNDHDGVGGTLLSVTLIGLVAVFVTGKRDSNKNEVTNNTENEEEE